MTHHSITHPRPDSAVVQEASRWIARMWSEQWTEADQQACDAWRAANPAHDLAWQRLLGMTGELLAVPRRIAHRALLDPERAKKQRRQMLRSIGGLGLMTALLMRRGLHSDTLLTHVNLRTGTGELRRVTLADGTRLTIGPASVVDVLYTDTRRVLILRNGQIHVETARDPQAAPAPRPFEVLCEQGSIRPIGTRFDVHRTGDTTSATVYGGAVIVSPAAAQDDAIRLDAGQMATFTESAVIERGRAVATDPPWASGKIIARNMPLAELLREFSRYRSGVLRCDPALADLRVTGVFRLQDTDQALLNLAQAMQLKLTYITRYWVNVDKL